MVALARCAWHVKPLSTRPTAPTRSGSRTGTLVPGSCPRRHGSIPRKTRPRFAMTFILKAGWGSGGPRLAGGEWGEAPALVNHFDFNSSMDEGASHPREPAVTHTKLMKPGAAKSLT